MKVKGSFYLKSGVIIEEFCVLKDDDKTEKIIDTIKEGLKDSFKNNTDGFVSFGYTIFRGSDLSAVTFTEVIE